MEELKVPFNRREDVSGHLVEYVLIWVQGGWGEVEASLRLRTPEQPGFINPSDEGVIRFIYEETKEFDKTLCLPRGFEDVFEQIRNDLGHYLGSPQLGESLKVSTYKYHDDWDGEMWYASTGPFLLKLKPDETLESFHEELAEAFKESFVKHFNEKIARLQAA
jgi:hypothetical protein